MSREKYILSPYIVELMQGKVPFAVFHEDHRILEGDEIDEYNAKSNIGLVDLGYLNPRMMGHHFTDKNGRSGYVLKNTNGLYDLTIPDEIINQGYEAVKAKAKESDIILLTPHEWEVNKLRRSVAYDIANEDLPFEKVMEIFEKWDVFSNWDDEDFHRRPVNVDDLRECIEQEMGFL